AARRQIREWYDASLMDLRSARRALEDRDFLDACFHAQQAAEKALKAFLRANGIIPWGHDVEALLLRARKLDLPVDDLLAEPDEIRMLNEQYMAPRYPNFRAEIGMSIEDYTEELAERCIKLAEEIFRRVEGWLSARGLI
ncbi:TPA: HEPN domain-containing protein, partial [Candidatus Bathyarchaeota archaeon]|nr:HEPN domain-containing protein [Candidatus Bathyarchaeota archaeon]